MIHYACVSRYCQFIEGNLGNVQERWLWKLQELFICREVIPCESWIPLGSTVGEVRQRLYEIGVERSWCDPIGFRQAIQVALLWGPNVADLSKPIDTAALIGAAVYFMCREIEITGSLQHELSVEQDASSFSLLLPATKKDTFGVGTTRTIECFCDIGEFCLPHYLIQYQATLKTLADRLGEDSDEMPLFPNPLGSALTKAQVVAVLREIVTAYQPDCSQDMLARITGHTFRITGARLLCGMGLDPVTVSIHGRWSSNAVLTYLAEAPLLSMN